MTTFRVLLAMLAITALSSAQLLPYRVLDESLPANAATVDAAGDFDGDGKIDLLAASGILLGDGNGTFAPAPGAPLAGTRWFTRVADFNGDGLLDVVSGSIVTTTIQVDFNAGGLVFVASTTAVPSLTTTSGTPLRFLAFAKGDVDGDGDIDLLAQTGRVVGPHLFSFPTAPTLLLNDGTGTFGVAPSFPVTSVSSTSQEELVDIDGDGDLDVLMVGSFGASTSSLLVMTKQSTGNFTLPSAVQSSPTFMYFSVGDFNGDGINDVVLSGSTANTASILFGSPTGLVTPVTSPMPFWLTRFIPMDLNGDGRDEILASTGYNGTPTVFPVSTSGVIGTATQAFPGVYVDQSTPGPDVIADYDADGDRDVALAIGNQPSIFMNGGAGTLVQLTGRLAGFPFGRMPVAGDLDGDGDLDLAGWAGFGSAVATMTNDGDGFFVPGPSSTIAALNNPQKNLFLHPFDVDGDGDADLYAAPNITSSFGSSGNDFVLRNNGGSFSVAFSLSNNAPVEVIADLDADGDGDRDIILGRRAPASFSNGVALPMLLLVNAGVGGFLPPIQLGGNHATYDLEIADFNGDGLDDIFQTNANANAGTIGGPEPCVLYLRTGAGAFTPYPQPAMTGYYSAAGDLNGDGLPDVVLDNQVWFNSGGTTFLAGPGLSQAIGSPPALADVDEDGDLDIVEAPAAVMLNTGGGVFGPLLTEAPYSPAPPTAFQVDRSIVADLDRDGDLDVFGTDVLVHLNCRRQVAFGARPRPGRPGSLQLWGNPGSVLWLFASGSTASFAYPPFGNVLIDPATAILVHGGIFGPPGSATPGFASIQGTLPANPALVGLTLYWQMVDMNASRLSNRLTTTIMGY